MTYTSVDERRLSALHPPRRNRYYYGKLMDVRHFSMEQAYGMGKRWLLNRAVLGTGVVEGLQVQAISTPAGHGVRISPGLAIDGWGREIIVPHEIELVPLRELDTCCDDHAHLEQPAELPPPPPPVPELARIVGHPATMEQPSGMVISICYRECSTDFAPALVSDPVCDGSQRCEAGTWVESYCLHVQRGHAPVIGSRCRAEVQQHLQGGDVHGALCVLLQAMPLPDPRDPCVVLANVIVDGEKGLVVDACEPRPIVATNRMLVELLTCVVDRVEQCCGKDQPTTATLMKVSGVRFENSDHVVLGEMKTPVDTPRLHGAVSYIHISLTEPYLPGTFTATNVLIYDDTRKRDVVRVAFKEVSPTEVLIEVPGNQISPVAQSGLPPGGPVAVGEPPPGAATYIVRLVASPPDGVRARDNTPLDGEPSTKDGQFPTGNDVPGGDFVFTFTVSEFPVEGKP